MNYAVIGSIAGFFAYIVGFAIRVFKIPIFQVQNSFVDFSASVVQIDLRNQVLNQGYFADVGVKVLEFLQGQFEFSFMTFLGSIVGMALLFMAGRLLVGAIKPNQFLLKNRVWASAIVGGIVAAVIMPFAFALPFFTSLFSMVIYTFILGGIMQMAVNSPSLKFIKE